MAPVYPLGVNVVIARVGGTVYAVAGKCGNMNAPLEMGTLEGSIHTCAMHCAQFDVTTGEALSGIVPLWLGNETLPPRTGSFLKNVSMLMEHVRIESIGTYKAKEESDWVLVAF
jgi:nitrite reductase/ring-hydroxylating ferredoxin subunit